MQYSTNLINSIITFINEEIAMTSIFEAIRSYEAKNLPVPIKQTYIAFSTKENSLAHIEEQDGTTYERNNITIRMNCYTPLSSSTAYIYSVMEIIAESLNVKFGDSMNSFTLGEVGYDNNVNAYKIPCYLYFTYKS